MTDWQAQLEQLAGLAPHQLLGRSIDLLLEQLDQPTKRHLTLCAIPHLFNADILQILDPDLSADRAADEHQRLSQFAIVMPVADGHALHDDARRHLFERWLREENRTEFKEVNARLVTYLSRPVDGDTQVREIGRARARMFHRIGASQTEGFAEFERMCRDERRRARLTACRTLINLVHEYDPIVTTLERAKLAYHEGKLASDLLDWERAQAFFGTVIDQDSDDRELTLKAVRRLGLVFCEMRDWKRAKDCFERALQMTRVTPNLESFVPWLLRDLGVVERDEGNYDAAETALRKSIEKAKGARDERALATTWNSLGALYLRRRDTAAALSAFSEAYNCQADDSIQAAQLLNNMALACLDTSEWGSSRDYFERSLTIKRELCDTRGQALTLGNLAALHERTGNTSASIHHLEQSIVFLEEVHDYYDAGMMAKNLGRLYRRTDDLPAARQQFSRAVGFLQRTNDIAEVRRTEKELEWLGKFETIPWWAWLCLVAALGLIVLVVLFIAVLVVE